MADNIETTAPDATHEAPATLTPTEQLAAQYDYGDPTEQPVTPLSGSTPEPEQPAPAPARVSHKHPPYLVRMALEQGFSEEDISSTSPDTLGDIVHRVQRQMAAQRERDMAQQAATRSPDRTQPPPPPAQQEDDVDLGLSPEEIEELDPRLVKAMKSTVGMSAKKIKSLEQKLERYEQLETARQNETNNQKIDRLFSDLGPEYIQHFGKGEGQKLKASDQKRFDNRLEVLTAVGAMEAAENAHSGGKGPLTSMEEKFKKAVKLLFQAAAPPEEDAELTKRRQEWSEGTLAKPTQRSPAQPPKGTQRAIKTVEKFKREQAVPVPDSSDENGFANHSDFLG